MSEVTLNKKNFEELVLKSDKTVLVDFWASWCTPCKMIAPTLEKIARAMEGKAVIAKLNIDDEPELASSYRVMSIPTLMVFKDGKVVNKAVGVQGEAAILKMLES